MARVFVSHAHQDRGWADQLHQWLVAEGHEVFLDRDLRGGLVVGEDWGQRLHERLRWADAVVCVVTSAAVASTWCTAEVSIALSRDSRLLPVRAEPRVDHPLLKYAQYADLTVDSTAGRAALMEALRRVDTAGGSSWPDDRSPFLGLRPFDVEDHRVFFGRSAEVKQLSGLLRSPTERAEGTALLVAGPSGCGKSSLVRAGLLHVMAEEPGWWTLPPVVPGADPVAGLVRELAAGAQRLGLDLTVEEIRHRLNNTGLTELADELLLAARARRLLLVVDQFEELLTQAPDAQRARFAQLLRPALGGPVQVVAPLRSEFLDQLLLDDAMTALVSRRPYTLRPLRRDGLRAVIMGPAQVANIGVNEDLVTQLVDDTDSGEALPLLAFTLAQLAQGVGRGGQLSQQRYDELGGVQGALTRQADLALADASAVTGRCREEVIAGLLHMVTVDEQGRPTRWRVPRAQLPKPVTQELDAFIGRRLVTTDTERGSVVVGVAHEACLYAWLPLAEAIDKNVSALRARRAVEQAAAEWHDEGGCPPAAGRQGRWRWATQHRWVRKSPRLWERGQLAAALAATGAHLQAGDVVSDRVKLSPTARAFLQTSIRWDRVRRGLTVAVLSVLLVIALVAAGIAAALQRVAEQQRDVAVSRQIAGQVTELRVTNPALAAQLALAAYRLVPTPEARGSLLSTLATPYATRLTGHTSTVNSVAFSLDGHTLATASYDKTTRLWDVSNPRQPHPLATLTGHTDGVRSVAFSPDGHTLATASYDKTTRLWDVSNPHHASLLSTVTGHTNTVGRVAFSPDGHTLATASYDNTTRLWDISNPRQPHPLATLTGHTDGVYSVAFSPDGLTLATGSADRTARVWDVSNPRQPHPQATLTGHTGSVIEVAFSPDGHTLATASTDTTARLWDVSNPRQPHPLATLIGHTDALFSVAFSPDGHTLATGSADTTARVWDVSNPRQPHSLETLTGHTDTVHSVAFSPDGHSLATGSYDDTARLWDLPGPIVVGHTGAVNGVAFAPDGRTLATGSDDKTVRLWDVSNPRQPHPLGNLTGHNNTVAGVAFSPDGHTLATASTDTTARLWDVSNPRQPRPMGTLTGHTNGVRSVAFSPDGHTLVTGSYDTTARLWDVSNPRQPRPMGTLTGHTNTIYSVAFSPDGHTLATGSTDTTARLWETNVESVATRICGITGTITKNEWNHYIPGPAYRPPCP